MTPILYTATETAFASNGLGMLTDAISCTVTEERNGAYELSMRYPVTGIHFEDIALRSLILAKPNPIDDPQPYRVYAITKPMAGIVTISAEHITYDMSGMPVSPFTAGSLGGALAGLTSNAATSHSFTFWTDKVSDGEFTVSQPSSMRSCLGGQAGSILDVYGGEWQFDRFTARLWFERGMDRGVTIRYGKNLIDLEQEENCAAVYTGIYPYYVGDSVIQLPEKILYAAGTYDFTRILPLDMSGDFDEAPTVAQLREAAQAYLERNNIGVPKVSLKLSFVQLEQTEEYAHLALLERVSLCDTVSVEFAAMGVSATAKCVKTVYNALLDRYDSVELGEARTNIADVIAGQEKAIERIPNKSFLLRASEALTKTLLGADGGDVRFIDANGDGAPDTLYIADDPDPAKALKVWRFNYEGWGASKNGYNGPFVMGASLNDGIIADFITAGTLDAALIRAGILSSLDGRVQFDLEAGTLYIRDGSDKVKLGFDAAGDLTISGHITATGGKIGGFNISGDTLAGEYMTLKPDVVGGSLVLGDVTLTGRAGLFVDKNVMLSGGLTLDYGSGALTIVDADADIGGDTYANSDLYVGSRLYMRSPPSASGSANVRLVQQSNGYYSLGIID